MKCIRKVIIILVLLPAAAYCFGFLDAAYSGTAIPGYSAVSLGLGGVRSIGLKDGSSTLTNPAGLARGAGTRFSLAIGPGIGNESVLDSLGEDENNWISFGNLFAGARFRMTPNLCLGLALAKISDFSYKGTHYTYEFGMQTELTKIRKLKVSGGAYESALGLSYTPAGWLNLGFSAGMRFGSASYDSTYEDVIDPDNDTTLTWEKELDGFSWHAGIEFPFTAGLAGVSLASETDYCASLLAAGGILYLDDNRRGGIGGELELVDPGGNNAYNARIFADFYPSDSFEIRSALFFGDPAYENIETELSKGFSIGTGIHLGNVVLNGGVSWTSSSRDSLTIGGGSPDDISSSQALLSLGLDWEL